jgi:hypothetical protein
MAASGEVHSYTGFNDLHYNFGVASGNSGALRYRIQCM